MHSLSYILCLLASLISVLAAPQVNTQTCQDEGIVTQENFKVSSNIYAASTGKGYQCSQINSDTGSALAWSTTWAWQNIASDNQAWNWIKSYAYAYDSSAPACKLATPLSQMSGSIRSQWSWSYSGEDVIGDVAYDAFLGEGCSGTTGQHSYEVMIWLAALGSLGPIGSSDDGGSAFGFAPRNVKISNYDWVLYYGMNDGTNTPVYSFIPPAGTQYNSFGGDLMPFFTYLKGINGALSSLFLQSIQAGTEAVNATGPAVFTTLSYSIG
ncbi:hypothetical protein HO173_004133 [Letharia columbiana]|uniref:Glycoside hydrolase family 12 protein n=1 Tax=Letharia columbiana TaxID=112416 RepID=A0A8H6FZW1_9LECA|nr:uncharacterized protein HO173_004133 [Letharia columbiana]KAF6237932.1 hypothetical protein HO173_004133 [Letharia columbiana]